MHKPFEIFMSGAYLETFFIREGAPNFVTFSSVVFSAEFILSNLSNKNDSRGVRGHAPPGNF